jgi:hypothetical protein
VLVVVVVVVLMMVVLVVVDILDTVHSLGYKLASFGRW